MPLLVLVCPSPYTSLCLPLCSTLFLVPAPGGASLNGGARAKGPRGGSWQRAGPHHVLDGTEVLGAVAMPVVISKVSGRVAILVTEPQVDTIHHEDLTALEGDTRKA